MIDSLLQMGLSNACIALALAIVAMIVGITTKRPQLTHLLWLLVFVKLVTPPIMTIPVVTIPEQPVAAEAINNHSRSGLPIASSHASEVSRLDLSVVGGHAVDVSRPELSAAGNHEVAPLSPPANHRESTVNEQAASLSATIGSAVLKHGKRWLPPIWLLGTVMVFIWSLIRVGRFGRMLAAESEVAPPQLQAAAARIARRLGLKTMPTIRTTSARISPMVWWTGGKVRIIIPAKLLDEMDAKQWQWVLAHELAHVRRRDYLVRWLEWLSCVCFWWNPVVWWAQHNLRAAEEICCDALVLSSLNPKPHSYAKSILTAVESLACSAIRPPAMASEINSGGFLERRFRMIIAKNPSRSNSRWLQVCILFCAILILPFGLAWAQDYEAIGRRLRDAVEKGEITRGQAGAMMEALKGRNKNDRDDEGDVGERIGNWVKSVGERIEAAVEADKLSEEDAWKKWHHFKNEEVAPKLKAVVKEGKLSGEKARAIWQRIEQGEAAARLKSAVKAGKISEEEARAKWAEIERGAEAKHEHRDHRSDRERVHAHLKEVEAKLRAAVKADKMSEEDARRKMGEIKREVMAKIEGHHGDDRERVHAHLKEVETKLRAAVEAGKMSEEDARRKMGEIKREVLAKIEGPGRGDRERVHAHLEEVGAKLRAAVEAGKMSEEDARRKMGEIKREVLAKIEGQRKGDRRDDRSNEERAHAHLREVWEHLQAAVKAGKMSEEDSHRKMGEIKREVLARIGRGHEERDPRVAKYHEIERHIRAAVEAGKLSPEDAEKKLIAVRKEMFEGDRERGSRREEVARRLREAVREGKLSEEDARAKWEAFERETEGRREERHEDDGEHKGVQRLPDEVAHAIGAALAKAANFDGAAGKAVGLFNADDEEKRGMILVPAQGFADEEKAPELGIHESAKLALLFTSPGIVPVTDKGRVDRDRIHTVTLKDDEGKEHQSNCITLIVKRISEDDYRVYGMGKRDEPLFESRVSDGEGPGDAPFAMEVKDIDEESKTAKVVITVFNKYQAGFHVGVVE